jgi:hypothetical protein
MSRILWRSVQVPRVYENDVYVFASSAKISRSGRPMLLFKTNTTHILSCSGSWINIVGVFIGGDRGGHVRIYAWRWELKLAAGNREAAPKHGARCPRQNPAMVELPMGARHDTSAPGDYRTRISDTVWPRNPRYGVFRL